MKTHDILEAWQDNNAAQQAERDEQVTLMNMENSVRNTIRALVKRFGISPSNAEEMVWERLNHMSFSVGESVVTKKALKQDAQRASMAAKAEDMTTHLNRVRDAKDIEEKKSHAREMAKCFKVGGGDKFLAAINTARTPNDVDRIAYNAALKGHGLGTKLY